MRYVGMGLAVVLILAGSPGAYAGGPNDTFPDSLLRASASRIGFSAGMGVSYVSPEDVVNFANSTSGSNQRVSQFTSAAEFFGTAVIPLSEDFALKLEYAHMLGSYSVSSSFYGQADYTFRLHLPTLFLQYILADERVYNVKAGVGAGFHIGTLAVKYLSLDDEYTGTGPGVALDLEANTALGESLFAYLGGNVRWEFVGTLTDREGRTADVVATTTAPTLHLFGLGARLGLTYYF